MTKITFEVHKYTSGGRTENVSLLDFGYSSLTGARVDLDNLREASPSDEFKLVIQGATHLPYTNADGSGAYIGLALCQSTDGPLTEGAARDEIADVTCPVCREVYEARLQTRPATYVVTPWGTEDRIERPSLPVFGIQSIETGIVFARQGASSAVEAERLFRADNPEYDRPGVVRAVPGFPHDAELGRSPLIEREPTLKETAARMARLAEKDVEERIAILKSAVDLAVDDLLGAEKHARHYAHNDQAAPLSMTALALRTAIHAATKKALADEELLLAQYKAVR